MSRPIVPLAATPSPNAHSMRGAFTQLGHWLFGNDGLTFSDLLDVVNPLQHIPVVSTLYRRLTGDHIDPAMQLAGGALYGGPLGVGLSALGLLFDETLAPAPDSATPAAPQVASTGTAARAGRQLRPPVGRGHMAITPATRIAAARLAPIAPSVALTQARGSDWLLVSAYAKVDAQAREDRPYGSLHEMA